MNRQDIIQKIEAYEAREQSTRQRLEAATDDKQRAGLERDLRIVSGILFCLADQLKETIGIDLAGRLQRAAVDAQNPA
jgi:hypothetical protein